MSYDGMTAQQVIPGDPNALESLGQRLCGMASGLDEAAKTLSQIEAGSWQGQAADSFRQVIGQQPGKYAAACSSFSAAGAAIQTFARELGAAQGQVAKALGEWDAAQAATHSWRSQSMQMSVTTLGGVDPGVAGRAAAVSSVHAAQAQLDAAAAQLRASLAQAERAAPRSPSFLERMFHDGETFIRHVFGWDSPGGSTARKGLGTAAAAEAVRRAAPPQAKPKLPAGASQVSNSEIVRRALAAAPNGASGPASSEATAPVGGPGGQCRVFVQTIITAAGIPLAGAYANPEHDYYAAFEDAGAYRVPSPEDAVPGDVVQIGEFESGPHLHTFIIIANDPATHTFAVVDSNAGYDERIRYYTRPYPTGDFRIYRLGQP